MGLEPPAAGEHLLLGHGARRGPGHRGSHDAVTLWSRSPGAGWPPVRLLVVRVQEPGVEAEALPVYLLGEGVQLLLQRRVLQVQTLKLLLYQTEQLVQFGPATRNISRQSRG